MAHPLGVLLGQYVPPVGGIPLEGPSGIAMEALGRPAIGLDLRHLSILLCHFLSNYRVFIYYRIRSIETSSFRPNTEANFSKVENLISSAWFSILKITDFLVCNLVATSCCVRPGCLPGLLQ